MAKGAYIGVSGKARKIKKIYIGVNGKARKVKKAYIGVNDKARLFYSAGFDANSFTETSANQASGTGNYSLATHIGGYAIFGGGTYSDEGYSYSDGGLYAVNASLTQHTIVGTTAGTFTSNSGGYGGEAGYCTNYAVFVAGFFNSYGYNTNAQIRKINSSLTMTTAQETYSYGTYGASAELSGNYIVAGGYSVYDPYYSYNVSGTTGAMIMNASGTVTEKENIVPAVESNSSHATVGNYAIFGGGGTCMQQRDSGGYVIAVWTNRTTSVKSLNTSLTSGNVTAIPEARFKTGSASAVYGGHTSSYAVIFTRDSSDSKHWMTAYNSSLTQSLPSTSINYSTLYEPLAVSGNIIIPSRHATSTSYPPFISINNSLTVTVTSKRVSSTKVMSAFTELGDAIIMGNNEKWYKYV